MSSSRLIRLSGLAAIVGAVPSVIAEFMSLTLDNTLATRLLARPPRLLPCLLRSIDPGLHDLAVVFRPGFGAQ